MIRGMTVPSFMDLALKTAKNAGKSGEVFFKLRHVRPKAERAVVNGARDGGVKVLADAAHLCRQVKIGNRVSHGFGPITA